MSLSVRDSLLERPSFWESMLDYVKARISAPAFAMYFQPLEITWFDDQKLVLYLPNSILASQLTAKYGSLLQDAVEESLGYTLKIELASAEEQTAHPEAVTPQPPETNPLSRPAQLPGAYSQSLHDLFVHPERSLVVPGYLTRWVPYLGVERAAILLAFYQAYYLQHHEQPAPGKNFEAAAPVLAAYSGVSLRSVKEHRNDAAFSWFLQDVPYPESEAWVKNPDNDNKAKRRPNRYQFTHTAPLTPADAQALRSQLLAAQADSNPAETLARLITRQPNEILAYPAPVFDPLWETRTPQPQTIHQVVAEVVGEKVALDSEILSLTDALAARLMPKRDQLFISLYFLQNILPVIGQGAGWTVMLARDRCYYNRQTGELRDTVRIQGGYEELADAIGYARPKTIREWFPAVENSDPQANADEAQRLRSQLLALEDIHKDGRGKALDFTLRVRMLDPLTAAHQQEYLSVLHFAEIFQTLNSEEREAFNKLLTFCGAGLPVSNARGLIDALSALNQSALTAVLELNFAAQNEKPLFIEPGANCTLSAPDLGGNCTLTSDDLGAICTIKNSNLGAVCTLSLDDLGAICTLTGSDWALSARLNFLNFKTLGYKSLKQFLNSLPQTTSTTTAKPVVADGQWQASELLKNLGVLNSVQERLAAQNVTAEAILSCLIYLCVPAGEALGTGYVVKKLEEEPAQGQGGVFFRLAQLPAESFLRELAQQVQDPGVFRSANRLWNQVFAQASTHRLVWLARICGLNPDDSV
jgi:hypothetical protein